MQVSFAQAATVFGPPGATWYYSPWTSFSQPPSLFTFVAEADTMINGINARILQFYNGESGVLQPVDSLNKYVYTNGNKVFYYVEDDFYLLFDFGAQPGDTIHSRAESFPIFMGCGSDFSNGPIDFSYTIDSLGSIIIDGEELRMQHITPIHISGNSNWSMDGPIIERIGLSSYSNFWWGRGDACILSGIYGILRCYEDQDIFFKNPAGNEFNLDCDEISSAIPIVESTNPIYPNPSNDFITLPTFADVIHIYNYTGQKLISYINQERIDITFLQPNIYFIRYRINNVWYTEKFIRT